MVKIDKSLYLRMGELLRKKREERGYSLEQVAEAVGLTKKTIQRYETAESRVTTDNLKKICDFMGIEPREVTGFFLFKYDTDNEEGFEVDHVDLLEEIEVETLLENTRKFTKLLSQKPELYRLYFDIYRNEKLQELNTSLSGLSDSELTTVITIIRGLKKGRV
jgi:transcriptional regulator with XRE-family HTH domain